MRKNLLLLMTVVGIFIGCGGDKRASGSEGSEGEKEVVSFIYHRFSDARFPSTNTSIADFRAHLQLLKDSNVHVLTFSDAVDYLKSSRSGRKTAVITIDDGYKSFYQKGFPLLKEFGFPATLFINTGSVGGSDYMDWKQLKEVSEGGIEIGNHTHSHDYFLNLPERLRYDRFRRELDKSQQLIQENLGIEPESFAYPFGEFDEKMKRIVQDGGFKSAVAQNSGVIYSGTDLYMCPRFPMSESYSAPEKFASKLAMHALQIEKSHPESFVVPPGQSNPELVLEFSTRDLVTDQLQCFIQGSGCEKSMETEGLMKLTIRASAPITDRRRTLYTVTIPNKNGEWYWYSHLWINTEVQ